MALEDTAQEIHCNLLQNKLDRARSALNVQSDRRSGLQRKLRIEENQLQSLRRQAKRTGDPDGFGDDILTSEQEISNLEQEIDQAEAEQQAAQETLAMLESQITASGCAAVR